MQLKLYQQGTLDVLGDFLAAARMHGPAAAYADIVAAGLPLTLKGLPPEAAGRGSVHEA